MIDAVLDVAVFAALGLCIFGFGAWGAKASSVTLMMLLGCATDGAEKSLLHPSLY